MLCGRISASSTLFVLFAHQKKETYEPMFTKEITIPPLDTTAEGAAILHEVYEQMGYGDATPDDDVLAEVRAVGSMLTAVTRPRLCYTLAKGTLDTERNTLTIGGTMLNVGRIISRQLRGAEAFALFVATAGAEFEDLQMRLKDEDDMVRTFIADAFGSVIAEHTADVMEQYLQDEIGTRGWRHTNRFSPGYCGWHVSEQQRLFPLFGVDRPCGVRLTDSSLMVPIKSVSGVIGLGERVRKLEYSCGLCDYKDCYKRRKHPSQ